MHRRLRPVINLDALRPPQRGVSAAEMNRLIDEYEDAQRRGVKPDPAVISRLNQAVHEVGQQAVLARGGFAKITPPEDGCPAGESEDIISGAHFDEREVLPVKLDRLDCLDCGHDFPRGRMFPAHTELYCGRCWKIRTGRDD